MFRIRRLFGSSTKETTRLVTFLLVFIPQLIVSRLECQTATSSAFLKDDLAQSLRIGDAGLTIAVEGPQADLSNAALTQYIVRAAETVALYYGHFPVPSAHIVISISPGRNGALQGTTWGDRDGFPALTKLRVGQGTTQADLDSDWIATHELVHMALASLPDSQHWLEEGVATYVEPIARVQNGQLSAQRIWGDMMAGMTHGEPQAGDLGLDRTHTWGRTYWGGALFCLVADVEIRKQTDNKRGLQDALRGIVNAGGTIDKDWPTERVLRIGDKATGTTVLEDLYRKWSRAPVEVDLTSLWSQLGISLVDGNVIFIDDAPLAAVRTAITTTPRP